MVGLRIKFDLGRYHANPWGSHVNDAATEWPPSPWRMLRGLYSVGRTHTELANRRTELDRALATLASAPPPVFELPPATAAHTRHYMPAPSGNGERSAKILDGFLALDPEAELIAWWDANLDADSADALAAAARALGYLGRSESVCTAALTTAAGPGDVSAGPLDSLHEGAGEVETIDLLCVAAEEPLAALSESVTEIRQEKQRWPPGTRRITYGVRRQAADRTARSQRPDPRPKLAVFRVRGGGRPPLFEAVATGQLLRNSLQSRFGRGNRKTASPTFSGKAGDQPRSDQHRHAHYLSLPDEQGRRTDHLLVWAPEGLGGREVEALASLRVLVRRDWHRDTREEVEVALTALGDAEGLQLPAVLGPSRRWTSHTPFGLVRHPKRKRDRIVDSPEDQVRAELAHRNLPQPRSIEIDRNPKWQRFRSSKVGTSRLGKASLVGVTIDFGKDVPGPISLGALSHYGLGLMKPSGPA